MLFYPKLDEYDLNIFNDQQKQRLLEGKAIIGYMVSNEETKRLAVSDSSRLIQRASRYSAFLCQSSDATCSMSPTVTTDSTRDAEVAEW